MIFEYSKKFFFRVKKDLSLRLKVCKNCSFVDMG